MSFLTVFTLAHAALAKTDAPLACMRTHTSIPADEQAVRSLRGRVAIIRGDTCERALRQRPEDAVAGIAEAGQDVSVLVQPIVDGTGDDPDVVIGVEDRFDAFGCCE